MRDEAVATGELSGSISDTRVETSRFGAGLLAIVLLLTSIGGIAIGLWYPDGAEGDRYTYAQIRPMRNAWWSWHIFAGVNLVVGVCASALAGWLLVKTRGAVLARQSSTGPAQRHDAGAGHVDDPSGSGLRR